MNKFVGKKYNVFIKLNIKRIFFFFLLCFSFNAFPQSKSLTPFLEEGLWGYKDKVTGNIVVKPRYTFADYLFTNGYTKVVRNKKAGLINESGKEVVPCMYEEIEWNPELKSYINNDGLAKALYKRKVGLINSKNTIIAPFKYDQIDVFVNQIALVRMVKKYGYINLSGKEIIPCIYDEIEAYNDFLYAKKDNKIKLYNLTGNVITKNDYNTISYTYYKGLLKVTNDSLIGYIDSTGKEVIPCFYHQIIFSKINYPYFPEGVVHVKRFNKHGIITSKGKVIVPCEYDWDIKLPLFTDFVDVSKNGWIGIVNKFGNEVIPCKYSEINWTQHDDDADSTLRTKTLFIARYDENWGMLDDKNQVIIPFKYEQLENFSNGLAVAGLNGKYGYINSNDSVVIPFIYDYCQNFNKICAIAGYFEFDEANNVYNKFGLINKFGKMIVPFQYAINYDNENDNYILKTKNNEVGVADNKGEIIITPKYNILPFWESYERDSMIRVLSLDNYKFGFYNHNDRLVAECIYDEAYPFKDGLCKVGKNLKWGFINKKGEEIIPVKYDDVSEFTEGLALVCYKLKYGYVNTKGEEIIPIQYYEASEFKNGYARVKNENDAYGIINTQGTLIIPPVQQNILINNATNSYFTEGLAIVKQNSLYGYSNDQGNVVIPCKYTWADFFVKNRALVSDISGLYMFIDKKGNIVSPTKYVKAYPYNNKAYAIVKTKDSYQLIDTLGKTKLNLVYDEIKPYFNGTASVRKGKLWGEIDEEGKVVTPLKNESIVYIKK